MSTSTAIALEDAIRGAGEGWIIDHFSPTDQAIPHVQQMLEAVGHLGKARLGASAPDLSERAVIDEFSRNPARVRAFFQALGVSRTAEMLLMAWRIMQGMEIKEVQLSYHWQQDFHVRVVLVSPHGEEDLPYESSDINDFAIFRHIGVLQIDDRPVFDGFYPLRLS